MPIDEQVSALDKLMEKISLDDRTRRINQRIIPKYIDEAIENLLRSRVARSRFKALLLLADAAARDINNAVNSQVNILVKAKINPPDSDPDTPPNTPRKRGRKKIVRS